MREQAIALPPTLAAIIGAPKAPLSTIYAVRDRLITELDLIDGDTDLEEIDAEDSFALSHRVLMYAAEAGPGCTVADIDKGVDDDGEAVNEDGGDELLPLAPRYAIDQTLGPLNEGEAYRSWQHGLRSRDDDR